jgi:hypothetical protein
MSEADISLASHGPDGYQVGPTGRVPLVCLAEEAMVLLLAVLGHRRQHGI